MATKYISPTGSNGAAGTSGAPWRTLAYAITNTSSGDTIIFLDGTYAVGTELAYNQTITSRTLQAQNYGAAILNFGGAVSNHVWRYSGATTTNIVGLVLYNYEATSSRYTLVRSEEYTLTPTLNFTNCIFRTMQCYPGGSLYDGGIIGGVQGANAAISFSNCAFYGLTKNASAGAVGLFPFREGTVSITMTNNTFYFDATGTALLSYLFYNMANISVVMKNNILENVSGSAMGFAVNIGGTSVTGTYNNNCAHGTVAWTGLISGSNNITSDPLLVDAANANFKLRPTSPCLDTGVIV